MRRSSTIFLLAVAALVAAATCVKLGMGNTRWFSIYAFETALLIGLASIPLAFHAINTGWWTAGSVAGSIVLCVSMFFWSFIHAFGAGLPGTEFVAATELSAMLALPFVVGGMVVVKDWKRALHFFATTGFCLLVLAPAINGASRFALARQFETTLAQKGCVLVGDEARRQVSKPEDIKLGWFIGPSSERVLFVEGDQYYKWSYSHWGVETRRDFPTPYPVSGSIKCR